ncbi:MAG: shikimate kinase [candidate division NC10 bacterium]|jgi:shikimate kinase|nr:shikimate kinase [candidate division NC10 bacterium]
MSESSEGVGIVEAARVGNIVLTGMMGTGKTAVGRYLAEQLKIPFYDLDELIEQETGLSISAIFRERGEADFRALERELVTRLCELHGCIIATGGGTIVNPDNLRRLRKHGEIICLTAAPERILERVEGMDHRPLLWHADKLERIREVMRVREAVYAQVGEPIDTTSLSVEDVAARILARVQLRQVLKG